MARVLFAGSDVDRIIGTPGSAILNAVGATARVYLDAAGTQLADIQNGDGSANATATLTVTAGSELPDFLGPTSGVEVLYVRIDGGAPVKIEAAAGTRIAAAVAAQAAVDSATYTPWKAGNNRVVFGFDSIALGSLNTQPLGGESYPAYAQVLSGGLIQTIFNAGIGGNKLADFLARFDTDVTPNAPGTVICHASPNDASTTVVALVGQLDTLLSKCRAIGAVLIFGTQPPNELATPVGRKKAIVEQNMAVRAWAQRNNVPCPDFYKALVDATTGNYRATFTSDGTHPLPPGMLAMAQALMPVVTLVLPPVVADEVVDNNDPANLIGNGLILTRGTSQGGPPPNMAATAGTGGTLPAGTYFYVSTAVSPPGESTISIRRSVTVVASGKVDLVVAGVAGATVSRFYRGTVSGSETFLAEITHGSGAGGSFSDTGAVTPTSATPPTVDLSRLPLGWSYFPTSAQCPRVDLLTDPGVVGQYARLTRLEAAAIEFLNLGSVAGKFAVGDRLRLVAKIRTDGVCPGGFQIQHTGATNGVRNVGRFSAATGGWAVVVYDWVVPAGTTAINILGQFDIAATGSKTDLAQIGVRNLTAAGVVT